MRGLTIVIGLMLAASGGFAQKSGVKGSVFDIHGAVVPGITVTVKDPKEKEIAKVRSDSEGKFIVNTPTGVYSIEVGDGFSLFCRVIIKNYRVVNSIEPMQLDIVLTESRSSHDTSRCRTKAIKY